MTTDVGYAHTEFLVDAAWVDAHRGDANVVVVDTDVEAGYLRGHIPGAVMVPDNYEKDPDTGRVHILPPAKFAAMCQNLGIGDDTLVIAYDNNQSLYAARLWWALNTYGHGNAKVLNGGWRGWIAGGHGVGLDRPSAAQGVTFTPNRDESLLVKADELKEACSLEGNVVWDVRSDGEWDGSEMRGNQRAGHIPGAVHLEWFNVMDRQTHRFRPAGEIRQLLADNGITPDKNVYTY
jgi:thiosulfate/3-mercaptopyruvate sulfurtransferase